MKKLPIFFVIAIAAVFTTGLAFDASAQGGDSHPVVEGTPVDDSHPVVEGTQAADSNGARPAQPLDDEGDVIGGTPVEDNVHSGAPADESLESFCGVPSSPTSRDITFSPIDECGYRCLIVYEWVKVNGSRVEIRLVSNASCHNIQIDIMKMNRCLYGKCFSGSPNMASCNGKELGFPITGEVECDTEKKKVPSDTKRVRRKIRKIEMVK